MSDSVYITVSPAEKQRVKAFIDSRALQGYARGPKWKMVELPVMEDGLTYCEHRNCAGVNFRGAGHDMAHTFVLWLAQKLNKKFYWYDGEEKIEVNPSLRVVNSNWNPNKKDAPAFPNSTILKLRAENRARIARLTRFRARLDVIWDKFNLEYDRLS